MAGAENFGFEPGSGDPGYQQSIFMNYEGEQGSVGMDGSSTYSYPMGDVSMNYSSNGGWYLGGGSSITRSTKYGVPSYTSSDTFEYNGEELVLVKSYMTYRYYISKRYNNCLFKYIYAGNPGSSYWVVSFPDGSKAWFGRRSDLSGTDNSEVMGSRIIAPDGVHEGKPHSWMIAEYQSRGGYDVKYYEWYRGNKSQPVLKIIISGKKGTLSARKITEITYNEATINNKIDYSSGCRKEKLDYPSLVRIYLETANPVTNSVHFNTTRFGSSYHRDGNFNLISKYDIDYDTFANSPLNRRIIKITPYGSDWPNLTTLNALNPVTFEYGGTPVAFSTTSVLITSTDVINTVTWALGGPAINFGDAAFFMDVNGDGLIDRIVSSSTPNVIELWINKGKVF